MIEVVGILQYEIIFLRKLMWLITIQAMMEMFTLFSFC
jgi:hypothetical protein